MTARAKTETMALDPELLATLYRGPIELEPWRAFLRALAETAGCDNAAISLQLSRKGLASVTLWAEPPAVDPEVARTIHSRQAALGDLDPMSNALKRTGEILLLEEVAPREGLERDEFYLEVMKPYGIAQALGMYVAEPGGIECNLGLVSHSESFRFTARHKALMAALRPHVQIALELFSRIQRDESQIGVLTSTLDRLTIATFILDGRGRVLRMNKAAEAKIDRGETFRLADRHLAVGGRTDSRKFERILKEALLSRIESTGVGLVRAFRCADPANEGLGILVRAIERERAAPIDASPGAIVYATDPAPGATFEQLIAALFDLSPSEAGLAALLTQGFSLTEAAEELGLTESTVRSYSKRIFAKVGVSRQTELVRLILRSVAILG
ncbi:helix-turn-helix transcriptional regulator [Pelagerythrobacter aerophilus]